MFSLFVAQVDLVLQVIIFALFAVGMVLLIIALVGVIALEAVYILVTMTVSTELLVVISGLTGALASRFLEAKR
jgi:hypothetical protein